MTGWLLDTNILSELRRRINAISTRSSSGWAANLRLPSPFKSANLSAKALGFGERPI